MRRVSEPRRRALWLRGLWPDGNPLRRASDRLEALIVAAALLAFLIGAPVVALAAGHWAGSAALRVQRAEESSWRQVPAVLLAKAPGGVDIGYGGVAAPEVRARWVAPDRTTHTGFVPAPAGSRAGSTVRVWVDHSGQLTGPPLRDDQTTGQALLAAVAAPFTLGTILLCLASLAVQVLNRRRFAAWDADWQATEPRWTSSR